MSHGDGEGRFANLPDLYATGEERVSNLDATSASERRLVAEPPASMPSARYSVSSLLGEGGMGNIHASTDRVIGRDIAIKSLAKHASWARERFLREARIQGQLEHPVVVPVYDMGISEAGDVFFTMKRIVGKTLDDVLSDLRRDDSVATSRFTQRKLISALGQVALALAFAHARGVVHRDVKPANVMFGDYGEVYLLDWGIAKIEAPAASVRPPSAEMAASEWPIGILDTGTSEATMEGAVLGSPGYMAPEQAHGRALLCDGRTDIYSLGVLLYEVLTLRELHRGETRADLIRSTLALDGANASEVRPDVATDLDIICYRATRLKPEDRYQTMLELHEDLEAHLDGARDIERRMNLADEHEARATALREELAILGTSEGARAEGMRAEVLRELAAALVLAPTHASAQAALFELLTESPDSLPKSAEEEVRDRQTESARLVFSTMARAYLPWFAIVPFALWMGVRSWPALIVLTVAALVLVGALVAAARRRRPDDRAIYAVFGLNFVVVACLSMLFGPFIAVPQAALAVGTNATFTIRTSSRARSLFALGSIAAVLAPYALMQLGVLPAMYSFEHGDLVVHPFMVELTPFPTVVLLVLMVAVPLCSPARVLGTSLDELTRAERRSVGQAHRLRGYLPLLDQARSSRYTRPSV